MRQAQNVAIPSNCARWVKAVQKLARYLTRHLRERGDPQRGRSKLRQTSQPMPVWL